MYIMSKNFNRFNKNSTTDMQAFNTSKNSDYFTSEFEINDAPVGARYILTKSVIRDEITRISGAVISTRGRFIAKNDYAKNPNDRPLYLFIQGPTKLSIETAIQRIHEIIGNDIGNQIRSGSNSAPNIGRNSGAVITGQPVMKPPPLMGINTNVTQVEKLYIGLDGIPASFDLRGKIIGPGGSNLHFIRSETGAVVTLRGRGSQFVEANLGRESTEPLHLYLEHPQPEGLAAARQLAINLVETLVQELQQTEFPQQMNVPPPSLQQQHFTAPPQIQMDHSMIVNPGNNQGQQGMTQFQLQLEQRPPRLPTHVNIPPPGIHIPQHAGPLVPPPQLVQLTAPPPPVVPPNQPPPVLVVGPPPHQPLYLPPDLVASSIGTFSLLQGGVLYHQAPPIQTQAHIDTTHTHPPPQMIITQVQLDPNGQIIAPAEQINHNFQQPTQQKFQIIGQVQNSLNRDDNMQQSHQILRQTRDENFQQYSTTMQTSNTNNTLMVQPPYQMSIAGMGTDATALTFINQNQNQVRQLTVGQTQTIQVQQSNQEKQSPGQIQGADQKQEIAKPWFINMRVNSSQMQQNPPPNIQHPQEQFIQPILNQMPPNRLPPQQIESNQFQSNNPQGNIQQTNQVMSQQDSNNQQMRQMPPNQFATEAPQMSMQMNQQMRQQMYIQNDIQQQQQVNQQPPAQQNDQGYDPNSEASRKDSRRHDDQGRSRSGARNRRGPRNSRQFLYPWNRNEQERTNQDDLNWQRKESIREFEYERKASERSNDNRPRFAHGSGDGKNEDVRQYKNIQDNDGKFVTDSSNQGNQRASFPPQMDPMISIVNMNRGDIDHQRKERSPDFSRKRRIDQENSWTNRSDHNGSPDGKSSHKKRFESDDYKSAAGGSQSIIHSPTLKPPDTSKTDKPGSSKWSDKKGELPIQEENSVKNVQNHNSPDKNEDSLSQGQMENINEKSNFQDGTCKQLAPWAENRHQKGNGLQYPTTHIRRQSTNNDRQFTNYQSNLVNANQGYQGNLPYFLHPPSPPPPPPPQGQSSQHGLQYSQGNTPPNMMIPHSNIHQGFNHSSMGQHVIPNMSHSLPPNVNPQMQSNTNMGQNVPANLQQNIPFDMAANINTMTQHMPPGLNPNSSTNMPLGINQNTSTNMPPGINQSITANMPPGMNQNVPNNMLPGMNQNILNNMPPGINQNIPSHIPPGINQNMPTGMNQNIPNNMPQGMNQNVPTNMPPGINQNMPPGMNQGVSTSMPPGMNQNVSSNMPPGMNQGVSTNNMPPGINQNATKNISPGINQSLSTSMPPGMNHNVTANMPPGMNQNISTNVSPGMNQNTSANMPPGMNQSISSNMPPGLNQNIPMVMGQNPHVTAIEQNISPNVGPMIPNQQQNMGQNMMGQNNNSLYMPRNNIPHNMQQGLMNQGINPNMTQNMPVNSVSNPPNINHQPLMNQNMSGGMGQGMMGVSNPMNMNQNVPMGMQSMGQMPQNMIPSMVPPPGSVSHMPSSLPPPGMMPPNMSNRPHMPHHNINTAPPPPPQSSCGYWMN